MTRAEKKARAEYAEDITRSPQWPTGEPRPTWAGLSPTQRSTLITAAQRALVRAERETDFHP